MNLEQAKREAQVEANKSHTPIAVVKILYGEGEQPEYGYCPPSAVSLLFHDSPVIEEFYPHIGK